MFISRRVRASHFSSGFTIVELLIVVVVIAILAAVTLVAYGGIREQAAMSAMQSGMSQSHKAIELYKTSHSEVYPSTLAAAGLADSADVDYTYTTANGNAYYCLESESDAGVYFISSRTNGRVVGGSCDGLVGWWPLNQNTNDYSQYAYSSTATGISATTGQNASSGAYSFVTGNLRVSGFDHGVMRQASQASSWSMSAWARLTGTGISEATIIGRGGCHGGIYTYGATFNYTFAIKSSNADCWNGSQSIYTPGSQTGSWTHLAAVYSAGQMTFYVDGAILGSATLSATMNNYSTDFYVGGINSSRWFQGDIDDARVYNRAITQAEIQSIYQQGAF